jgi:hypothetical protein
VSKAQELMELLRQLADDMMLPANLHLNALINRDRYGDPLQIVAAMRKAREDLGVPEETAIEWGLYARELNLPVSICGEASNIVCGLFLDRGPGRLSFDLQAQTRDSFTELTTLRTKLSALKWKSVYLLRIDCYTHSYTMLIDPQIEMGNSFLIQANAAACMEVFTLNQWLQSPRSRTQLCAHTHVGNLKQLDGRNISTGKAAAFLNRTFGINVDFANPAATLAGAFQSMNYRFLLREIDFGQALRNIRAVYERAGLPPPPRTLRTNEV